MNSDGAKRNLQPLVSIIIITYNSSKSILDTLESIKNQSYQNIELIISDDSSTDHTSLICRDWLELNKGRFINSSYISVEINSGIPANCNRGLYKSKGVWIKLIAGDDLLANNCIERYLAFINENNLKPSFLFSNLVFFKKSINNIVRVDQIDKLITTKHKNQFLDYLCDRPTIAPTAFIHRDLLINLGGYNEDFKLLEDVPLFNKALRMGVEFNLLPENLVYYRISDVSISNDDKNKNIVSNLFLDSINSFYNLTIYPNLLKRGLFLNFIKAKVKYYFASNGNYPKKLLPKISYKVLLKLAYFEKKMHLYFKNL